MCGTCTRFSTESRILGSRDEGALPEGSDNSAENTPASQLDQEVSFDERRLFRRFSLILEVDIPPAILVPG